MGNQQSCVLTEEQKQVLLSAKFGDGHISTNKSGSGVYSTNCIHLEYISFKQQLLSNISLKPTFIEHNGYSQTPIYTLRSKAYPEITAIKQMSIPESLTQIKELGLALWLYDDGSLHKDKLFFNINTHKFSYEDQITYFIPFFNSYNIFPRILKERKKDGKVFYYLYVSRYEGVFEITNILNKYLINCYSYKAWDSETIQKWSKLQEQLKNTDRVLTNQQKCKLLYKITL